jgi:hypothetical protein
MEYETYYNIEKLCINTAIILVIILILIILFKSVMYVKEKSTVKRNKYSV